MSQESVQIVRRALGSRVLLLAQSSTPAATILSHGKAILPRRTVSSLADLTLVAWALVEVGVRVREGVQGKGRPDRDRATRVLIVMTLGAAIVAALGARSVAPTLGMPEPLRMGGGGGGDAGQRLSHHRRGRARPDRRLQRSLQVGSPPVLRGTAAHRRRLRRSP